MYAGNRAQPPNRGPTSSHETPSRLLVLLPLQTRCVKQQLSLEAAIAKHRAGRPALPLSSDRRILRRGSAAIQPTSAFLPPVTRVWTQPLALNVRCELRPAAVLVCRHFFVSSPPLGLERVKPSRSQWKAVVCFPHLQQRSELNEKRCGTMQTAAKSLRSFRAQLMRTCCHCARTPLAEFHLQVQRQTGLRRLMATKCQRRFLLTTLRLLPMPSRLCASAVATLSPPQQQSTKQLHASPAHWMSSVREATRRRSVVHRMVTYWCTPLPSSPAEPNRPPWPGVVTRSCPRSCGRGRGRLSDSLHSRVRTQRIRTPTPLHCTSPKGTLRSSPVCVEAARLLLVSPCSLVSGKKPRPSSIGPLKRLWFPFPRNPVAPPCFRFLCRWSPNCGRQRAPPL